MNPKELLAQIERQRRIDSGELVEKPEPKVLSTAELEEELHRLFREGDVDDRQRLSALMRETGVGTTTFVTWDPDKRIHYILRNLDNARIQEILKGPSRRQYIQKLKEDHYSD